MRSLDKIEADRGSQRIALVEALSPDRDSPNRDFPNWKCSPSAASDPNPVNSLLYIAIPEAIAPTIFKDLLGSFLAIGCGRSLWELRSPLWFLQR